MTRLNRIIVKNSPVNRFISFFIGVLDPHSDQITYVNAGHNPPLLVHAMARWKNWKAEACCSAFWPAPSTNRRTCQLELGDVVVLFSDGVTEATRQDVDEEFGEDRLAATLAELSRDSAKSIIEAINQRVHDFTNGAPPADDITLVVARRVSQ